MYEWTFLRSSLHSRSSMDPSSWETRAHISNDRHEMTVFDFKATSATLRGWKSDRKVIKFPIFVILCSGSFSGMAICAQENITSLLQTFSSRGFRHIAETHGSVATILLVSFHRNLLHSFAECNDDISEATFIFLSWQEPGSPQESSDPPTNETYCALRGTMPLRLASNPDRLPYSRPTRQFKTVC